MAQRSLLKEVNIKSIMARLNSRGVRPMVFPNFFTTKPVSKLTWETIIGDKGVPVMADIISLDASTPEKKREIVRKASGDIPKTAIKRSMNESEYLEYLDLKRYIQGNDMQSIFDLVFKDLDFCYNGVRAKMEYCCMQMISTGQIHLTESNNVGVVTTTSVDYGVPDANKTAVTTTWVTAGSATPLKDLETMYMTARNKGIYCKYYLMDRATVLNLLNATDTVTRLKNFINTTGKYVATLGAVNAYLLAHQLPQVIEIETSVRFENKANVRSVIQPFQTGRVAMVTDRIVGSIQHGPIAAETSAELKKYATLVKKDFILTSKWSEIEPFKEWTKAEANAFPVLNDPEEIFFLRTDNTNYSA
jgi:hypothetical protein